MDNVKKFRDATEAMYAGDDDRAAVLLAEASAVDLDQLAQGVERRSAAKSAANKLLADYPEVARDPDFQFLADQYVAVHLQNGLPVEAAIAQAGEQLAEKYGFGKYRDSVRCQRAKGGQQTIDEEDPSEVIAWLAKGRLGNAG